MSKKVKVTKSQIIVGAEFNLSIGLLKIVSIDKDGYSKGDDKINTDLNGKPYADDLTEITSFINQNL